MSAPLAYAQVRMQSRHGARAPRSAWQRLGALADYRAFLEQARLTGLKSWLSNVSPISPPPGLEPLLRAQWRARLAELASWLPRPYAAALDWSATLPLLPALAHLLRGEPAYPWMLDEPALKTLAAADAGQREMLLAQTEFAPLAREPRELPLLDRWLRVWQRRLPPITARERRQVAALVRLLTSQRHAFVPGAVTPDTRAAWATRRAFHAKVVSHFRRGFLAASGVLAYVVLEALELERVRAALVTRAWFPAEPH
jgi:hypothetical protein